MVLVAGLRYNPEFGRFASFWVIGCLAYYLVSTQIERRRLKISLSILILFLMVMEANLRLMLHNPSVPMSLSSRTLIELLVAIFIAYLLFYLRVNLIIGSRMAGYSYTLYVTHFPVLLLFQSLFIHNAEPGISPTVLFSFAACFVALVLARWAAVMESRKEAIQRYCTSSILLLRNKFLYVKKTT